MWVLSVNGALLGGVTSERLLKIAFISLVGRFKHVQARSFSPCVK